MFDEVKKYKKNGHFFFSGEKPLADVCNTPAGELGVFIVYKLAKGHIDLVYVGAGGTLVTEKHSVAVLGELREAIVNNNSWVKKIKTDQIDALDVYWYLTVDEKSSDAPAFVRAILLQKCLEIYGVLPPWNDEF